MLSGVAFPAEDVEVGVKYHKLHGVLENCH